MVLYRSYLDVPVSALLGTFAWTRITEFLTNSMLQTKSGTVNGYLWGRWPRETITYRFNAELPVHGGCIINPPYVDVKGAFFLPSASQPEVFDTLIRVANHTLLVSSYFDTSLGPNPNLKQDFPHITWCGEIAVLFASASFVHSFLDLGPLLRPLIFRYQVHGGVHCSCRAWSLISGSYEKVCFPPLHLQSLVHSPLPVTTMEGPAQRTQWWYNTRIC